MTRKISGKTKTKRNDEARRPLLNKAVSGGSRVPVLLVTIALACAMGCGGSSSSNLPQPVPTPGTVAGSVFIPVSPPLSPDTAHSVYTNNQARVMAVRGQLAATAGPVLDHWFFVANGTGLPTPAPGEVYAPAPSSTPYVMTVNGNAPDGAPNPNGGTAVHMAPFNPNATGAQLFKAVAAANGNIYLRSAESFQTSSSSASMLLGWSGAIAKLDLGYLSNWNTSVYLNQEDSPTGDNSAFQQWTYGTGSTNLAQLTNGLYNEQLYNSSDELELASQSLAPANQWYTYPNYLLEQVVAEPNSSPPFPAASDAGEQAAYTYFSATIGAPAQTCTIEGTTYSGIRCEYTNLTASTLLSVCAADALALANPGSYNGVTISASDWTATTTQLHQECLYAGDVQSLFANIQIAIDWIFTENNVSITQLASDVGVSASQNLNVVPIDIIEGILYTVLGATGNTAAGVFANLMETAVNTAVAAGQGNSLTTQLTAEVSALDSTLTNTFEVLGDQTANGENAVLQDWGRLSQIGPLTLVDGYNGLALTASELSNVEVAAGKGWQVYAMQQLLPIAYDLGFYVGSTVSPPTANGGHSIPDYDYLTYSTFGSTTGSYNLGLVYSPENNGDFNYPSSTVITNDIVNNGANQFELFNGLNGWSGLSMEFHNVDCSATFMTIFNATPIDLSVVIQDNTDGWIAVPGVYYAAGPSYAGDGSNGPYTAELRPYGYLPFYGSTGSGSSKFSAIAEVESQGTDFLNLEVSQDKCGTPTAVVSYPISSSTLVFSPVVPNTIGSPDTLSTGEGQPTGVLGTVYQP